MLGRRSKGQSTLEYVILIGFVVSALIAMGIYMKRGIQGKLRESTDQVGEQYSAGHTKGKYKISTETVQTENMYSGGRTVTNISKNTQTKTGIVEGQKDVYEVVDKLDDEKKPPD